MCKNNSNPYASPLCEVMNLTLPGVLCQSTVGGSTEDVGDLEDIFGNNN